MRHALMMAGVAAVALIFGMLPAHADPATVVPSDFVIDRDSGGNIWLVSGETRYLVDAPVTDDSILTQFYNAGVVRQFAVSTVPTATPVPPTATSLTAVLTPVPATATPAPLTGTRDNPLAQGVAARFTDGWSVVVVGTTANANDIVAKTNRFNDPPKSGEQFFIGRVQATYTGAGSKAFGRARLVATGAANVTYLTFRNSCGVIPDPISENETFSGGTITGNVCWAIRSSDAGSLSMFDDDGKNSDRVFLSLH